MRNSSIFTVCVLLLATLKLTASETTDTYATITTWAKSFNDATEGGSMVGANIKIVSLTFLVDSKTVGTIYRDNLISAGSAQIKNEISLSMSNPKFSILVTYSHHEWNLLGTIHYYPRLTELFPAGEVSFSKDNTTVTGTFNSFNPLDETIEVDWSLNYTILISPFEPAINQLKDQCYNWSSYLSLKTNNPVFYNNAGVSYQWQCGFEDTWQPDNDFLSFQNSIVSWLSYRYQGDTEQSSFEHIQMAIYGTDYNFMNSYYDLYTYIDNNKPEIIACLLIGINDQNNYLTDEERTFLSSYFYEAVINQPTCPPPNKLVIANWIELGTTYVDSIQLNPGNLIPVSPVKVRAGFRVRAFKSGYSPFSTISLVHFKPRSPSFIVNEPVSCPNRPTGEITLSDVSGVSLLNDFRYLVEKEGEQAGASDSFSGKSHTLSKVFDAGSYTVSVDYNDLNISGCSIAQNINIGHHNELSYDHSLQNETCPEKNDGEIAVTVTDYHGDYSFQLNDKIFYNTEKETIKNLVAGTYVLKVTDQCYNGSFAREETIQIAEPATVTMEITRKSNPTCLSSPNGVISVQSSGGNGFFDYELFDNTGSVAFSAVNQDTPWSFNHLSGGNYTVKTRSAGCEWKISESQSLAPVQQISFAADVTDVACFGENTGQITLTASGGKSPYFYKIGNQDFTNNFAFKSLVSGIYQLQVHTAEMTCNDDATLDVTVGTAPEIEIGLITVNASCFEYDDGQITSIVSGGTGPYNYSWEQSDNNGAWFPETGSSGVLAELNAGTYRLNVTDSENCRQSGQVLVTDPPLLVIESAVPRDVVCFGKNGSIEILASGGSGGYEFSCTNDFIQVHKSSASTINLPAGEYSVMVKDAKGCETAYENKVTITGPGSPLDFMLSAPVINGFNIPCSGDASGLIAIEALGGYENYLYSLSGSPVQATKIFGGLQAGSYDIKVTDGRGCSLQKSFNLTEPDPLTLNLLSSEPVRCFDAATGEIVVSAGGGIENSYKYFSEGTEMISPGIFKDLRAGTYEIEVSDINNCRQNLYATVQSLNPPIDVAVVPEDVRCFGEDNGELNTVVSGGSGGFTYLWELKTGEEWHPLDGNLSNRKNVVPGYYRAKATDSDNCFEYGTAEIREPSRVFISNINSHDIVCFGEKGSIEILGEGGEGSYTYYCSENSGGVFESQVPEMQVSAGNYFVRIKDLKGCEASYGTGIVITEPVASLDFKTILSSYGEYNVSCFGNNDGQLKVIPSGGNGQGYSGYTYQLSGNPVRDEGMFARLEAGNYDLTVTDGRGCRMSKPFTLLQPESKITLRSLSLKRPLCAYDTDGEILLTATGGAHPYEYSINNGSYTASAEFTNLAVDKYSFRVSDRNGCAETIETTLENIITEMKITGSVSNVKCFGENSGAINVSVTGGAKPFAYAWKDKLLGSSAVTGLIKGDYTVYITDSAGCKAGKIFNVSQPSAPLSIKAISYPACVGLQNGMVTATAFGGTPPYRYALDKSSNIPPTSSFKVYAGNHNVYVIDANNCISETGTYVNVKNIMPDLNFMLATSRYELDTLVVIDVSVPAPDRVSWEFSSEALVIDTGSFDARIKYSKAGIYPVKMTGYFGTCAYTIEKLLNIAPFDPFAIGENKNNRGIKSLKISPNPNDGRFELRIGLYSKQKVTVKVFDFHSRLCFDETFPADTDFAEVINLPGSLRPGTYVLWIISEDDARPAVFVMSR